MGTVFMAEQEEPVRRRVALKIIKPGMESAQVIARFEAELLRLIREEDPASPSARLSDSGDSLPSISAQRHTEPAKLTKLVRGELDWIVMKALDKDRVRRYETASGLARDIERYLADEAVEACPPSAAYKLRKFARRYRGPVIAATLVLLTLVGGIVGTSWGLVRAGRAQRAEAERAEGEKQAKQKALAAAKAEKKANARAQKRLAQVERGERDPGVDLHRS